ncbi:hypothetical protein F5Y08DRAFT_199036 [Xylaria arbuscula]|nr:hypothetical protein F5Y08DRAFT_199036 [Xylaria arbuscula]
MQLVHVLICQIAGWAGLCGMGRFVRPPRLAVHAGWTGRIHTYTYWYYLGLRHRVTFGAKGSASAAKQPQLPPLFKFFDLRGVCAPRRPPLRKESDKFPSWSAARALRGSRGSCSKY